ncbi:hypothetical protein [Singulisphaera sp. PoT]|uniref:hypothetical protein n=1 Tax=Singulisphaera sp. PoT TaxID=3411797 RepID=UPI003BF510E9
MSLESKARRQLEELAAWNRKVFDLVTAKVGDARAHLDRAVTDTLRRTPDGRKTLRRVVQSPSYVAAMSRMDELWAALAGPRVMSLEGVLRDARESFYRRSFAEWKGVIPADMIASPDAEPTAANAARVRGAILHGYDLRQEIGGPIARAKEQARANATLAGRRDGDRRSKADLLGTWEKQSRDAIWNTARLALSDGQVMADVQAGRDVVHPDYLDDSPITVGA